MIDDQKIEDFRRWALAVLGLLSATSDRQVSYLRQSNVGADELLLQFDDVLYVARARVADGSLEGEDFLLLLKVNKRVDSVNSGPDSIWTNEALEVAVEWRELRITAGAVEASLEKSWNLASGD